MGYRDGGYKGTPITIGAVAACVLGFAIYTASPMLKPYLDLVGARSEKGAEQALLDDPEAGRLFVEVKKSFPVEFGRIRKSLSESAAKMDRQVVITQVRRTLETEMDRNAHFIRHAPHAQLEAMRAANLAIVERLRQTALPVCAEFAEHGQVKDGSSLPIETKRMFIDLGLARFRAMAAGRDQPAERAAALAPGDVEALVDAMRRQGVSEAAIELVISPNPSAFPSPIALCDGTIGLLRAVDGLERESADRILVALYSAPPSPPPPPSPPSPR